MKSKHGENHPMSKSVLRDEWTHDPDYRRYFQTDEDIEAILKLLALDKTSTLVDIGCGNGAFAIAAARRFAACQVWACDALDSAVTECRTVAEGLSNFLAQVAWAHSIPLPDACTDRVLCRSVLHHIAEPLAVYIEISRLLKPGGRLVLQAPCNGREASFGQVLSEMMMLADDSHRRFYYTPAEIVAGLGAAGLVAREPECWPYTFRFLDDRQTSFIQEHEAAESVRLQPIEDGKWTIEGCWVRIVAEKTGSPPEASSRSDRRRQEQA
jgi:SAM-dependent methyltransferase